LGGAYIQVNGKWQQSFNVKTKPGEHFCIGHSESLNDITDKRQVKASDRSTGLPCSLPKLPRF